MGASRRLREIRSITRWASSSCSGRKHEFPPEPSRHSTCWSLSSHSTDGTARGALIHGYRRNDRAALRHFRRRTGWYSAPSRLRASQRTYSPAVLEPEQQPRVPEELWAGCSPPWPMAVPSELDVRASDCRIPVHTCLRQRHAVEEFDLHAAAGIGSDPPLKEGALLFLDKARCISLPWRLRAMQ